MNALTRWMHYKLTTNRRIQAIRNHWLIWWARGVIHLWQMHRENEKEKKRELKLVWPPVDAPPGFGEVTTAKTKGPVAQNKDLIETVSKMIEDRSRTTTKIVVTLSYADGTTKTLEKEGHFEVICDEDLRKIIIHEFVPLITPEQVQAQRAGATT